VFSCEVRETGGATGERVKVGFYALDNIEYRFLKRVDLSVQGGWKAALTLVVMWPSPAAASQAEVDYTGCKRMINE
jgi:hypothetical protein